MKELGKLILAATMVANASCSVKSILYKPSRQLDPQPVTDPAEPPRQPDPMIEQQWSLDRIQYGAIADMQTGSANVRIAILGTGIDYNHPELLGRVLINEREFAANDLAATPSGNHLDDDGNGLVDDVVGYDVIDNDGFAFDRHGGSTAVAGIIAARHHNGIGIVGLMSDVRLYPVRYIDDNGRTSVFHLIRALQIAEQAAPHVIFIHSTQFRLGGRFGDEAIAKVELDLLQQQLNRIRGRNIGIVIGAGSNNRLFGSRKIDVTMRSMDNIIVVTSSDEHDKKDLVANHSLQYVATAAPGTKILTLRPNGGFATLSSTAFAAAHVAGAYGLVVANYGPVGYRRIIAALTSKSGGDVVETLADYSIGQNRLNLKKLLAAIR